MDLFDALTLARLQFAFTVSFHIVFPAFTIGLASYLAVLEALWLLTGRGVYLSVFNYWKKIFALSFGMGVVSGIVMSYQFGTNWSVFSDKTGPVLGPLMGYEVLSAFFLEAGFLGVMLFGMKRVGRGLHFFATLDGRRRHAAVRLLDPVGQQLDAHAGRPRHQRCRPVHSRWTGGPSSSTRRSPTASCTWCSPPTSPPPSWLAPSAPSTCCATAPTTRARVMFSMAMWMAALVAPIQIVAGDLHGLNTLGAPAGQDRRHGGALGDAPRPAADPVRLARHGRRDDPLCGRGAEARQLDPHA